MRLRVVIRADASAELGLGHLKRCLSLALALRSTGAEAIFAMRRTDPGTVAACGAFLEAEGFASVVVGEGPVTDPAQDADDCARAVGALAPALAIVDHYALDAAWHRRIRRALGARLAAIDDLADRELDVDVVIDHNFHPDHRVKYRGRVPASASILGGPSFALLGPAYASARPHAVEPVVRTIGLFMGGTDAAGLSELGHRACRQAGFAGPIEIATTRGNPHLARLRGLASSDGRTALLVDAPELSGFYARHGLQVGAGGGATWERCCVGAPTVAVSAAPNQQQVLGPLRALGVLRAVDSTPPRLEELAACVGALMNDAAERAAMSAAGRRLVDGRGARRAAEALVRS